MDILIGAIAGCVISVILSTPLKVALSAMLDFCLNTKIRKLSHSWDTHYWYIDADGNKNEHRDRIKIYQLGKHVWGKNEGTSSHSYSMKGILENENFLTGTWKSKRPENVFHGTFQLYVSADGKSMHGKWLGLDSPDIINNGEWVWEICE